MQKVFSKKKKSDSYVAFDSVNILLECLRIEVILIPVIHLNLIVFK